MPTILKVLIIEDSEDDLYLLVRELGKGDFEVDYKQVDSLESFRDVLSSTSWDLVIADYNLPGFSALDALDLYKKLGFDLPFIIVSGIMGEDCAVEAMKSGAHDYMIKGNLTRLLPAIERELKKAEVRRENKLMEARIVSYQKQLQVFASELTLTEERERRRIATELHDRIGQTLAMSKIKLSSLKSAALSGRDMEMLDSVIKLIEQTIKDTRSLTFEISPTILYELGFEAAIEWLAEKLPEYGISVKVNADKQAKPLGDDVRILLFQVVRELLFNIIKHAKAKTVSLNLSRVGSNMVIDVIDDGVGFDVNKIQNDMSKRGFGLFSIKERLSYMGGEILINSDTSGTRVKLVAPLSL